MSDNSDYYSEGESDSETSEVEVKTANKVPLFKPSANIKSYTNGSDSEESELDDADNDELSDEEDKIGGGIEDRSDDGYDKKSEEDESEIESDDDKSDDDIELDEEGNPIEEDKHVKSNKKKKTQLIIEEDDDDDDDEYEENYLQKFDNEISKNYIDEFHPECLSHNYDEISKLSNIVRNSDGIIVDPLHKTIPYLTKYEKARILGQRAKQIETGSKPLVRVPENIVDGYIIAELELREKKIPFIIKRPIPGGGCEYWNLKDLENIDF
jgi:DNA-directed RNA polymerase I, II, and III subunit RPABC2